MITVDTLIIGAGAAGLMCAIEAGKRGRRVMIVDHARKPAEKIRISGGGRCNFTNINASPANYQSENPHFCKSALGRFGPGDFLAMVEKHGIKWHEKTLGQLFCDDSSSQIIRMLLDEASAAHVDLRLDTSVRDINKEDGRFSVSTSLGLVSAESLVIATGGPSIPKMGSSGFGYEVAKKFGHKIIPPRAALVPLTFSQELLAQTQELSGVALEQVVAKAARGPQFREDMLFTHRGLSGPVILQISSYWRAGESIILNLLPDLDVFDALKQARRNQPKQQLSTVLGQWLPKRVALWRGDERRVADLSDAELKRIAATLNAWQVTPQGSEGLRTAEVTLGGVDTHELSSKTMMSQRVKNLFFIGEVVDVTGHLGGYNFQWAWASGWCAGQEV